MAGFSEVFVTGTAAEVTPVRRIDTLAFETGPMTAALHADYEALVRMRPDEVEVRLAA
jgi:branched-chain amino acid aminotransferase